MSISRGSISQTNITRSSSLVNYVYRGNILLWSRTTTPVTITINNYKTFVSTNLISTDKTTYDTFVKTNF